MRKHILSKCSQYKKSWNLKREFLKGVLTFLEFNSGVFCFQEGIIHFPLFFFFFIFKQLCYIITIAYYYSLCNKLLIFLRKLLICLLSKTLSIKQASVIIYQKSVLFYQMSGDYKKVLTIFPFYIYCKEILSYANLVTSSQHHK